MYRKNNSARTLAILVAVVAIVGLGVGFAAFTRSLTIKPTATLNPSDSSTKNYFNLSVSVPSTCTVTTAVSGQTPTYGTGTATGLSGSTINVTGIMAGLKNPGDKVECTYTVNNASSYIAYLKSIQFVSTSLNGTSTNKLLCTNTSNTALGTLGETACGSITVSATAAGKTATVTDSANTPQTGISSSNSIAAKSGSTNGTGTFKITFEYTGTDISDENMKIWIPNLQLQYSTSN